MKRLSLFCTLSLLASLVLVALAPLVAAAADPESDFVLSTTDPSIVAGK